MATEELTEAINQLAYDVRSLNESVITLNDRLAQRPAGSSNVEDELLEIRNLLQEIAFNTTQ